MKQRIILSALLSVLTLTIHAADVSEQQARQIAAKMMAGCSDTPHRASAAAPSLAYVADKGGSNNLYVFNNEAGEGFVIVSGSDQTTASVLGYSDKGHFDIKEAPENLKFLLAMYEEQIITVRSKGTEANRRAPGSDELGNIVVAPLLKTTWNQAGPYNKYLTMEDAATGCVPTAMAQVMAYWKYPKQGRGSHAYDDSGSSYYADFNSSVYDWDNMLNGYAGVDYSEAQANAVARLMADCGISIEAHYGGLFGTSASTYYVPIALVKYFGYSMNYKYLASWDYETQEWEDMMRAELDAKRPFLYSGSPRSDDYYPPVGHTFVCDGYTDNGYFHFNLGWEGRGNGWYKTSSITMYPEDMWDFTNNQVMVIGIQPGERQTEQNNVFYVAINDEEAVVIGCNESACYDLDIASTVDIEGKPYQVTDIWQYAFHTSDINSASINSIKIPGTVKSITDSLFINCQTLSNVVMEDGPKRIGNYAFNRCVSLPQINIPASVTSIGNNAFEFCNLLNEINVGSSVMSIGNHAFAGCHQLKTANMPYTPYTIGDWAFSDCMALDDIYLGTASKIGANAFWHCMKMEFATIDAEDVGEGAFRDCAALKDVSIGATVKQWGDRVLQGCKSLRDIHVDGDNPILTSVDAVLYSKDMSAIHYCSPSHYAEYGYGGRGEFTIPETVTRVATESFGDLTKLTIPSTLVDIGEYAFRWCENLTDVYNYATTPQQIKGNDQYGFYGVFNGQVFDRPDWNKCKLHVLPGCKAAYQAAEGWNQFEVIEEDLKLDDTVSEDNTPETVRNTVRLRLRDSYYFYGLETDEFLFSSEPKLTYARNVIGDVDDLVFTTKDVEVTLYYDQVLGLYFTHLDDPTGIEDVKTDGERSIRYDITAQRIRVSGLQSGQNVSLFTLGGSLLSSAGADAQGRAELTLSGTSGTVYVVKVGGKAFKLTIK